MRRKQKEVERKFRTCKHGHEVLQGEAIKFRGQVETELLCPYCFMQFFNMTMGFPREEHGEAKDIK